MRPATNLALAEALRAVIKDYIQKDQAQSNNHCLHCSLARAHAHLEAIQEHTATILDLTAHSHRVPKVIGGAAADRLDQVPE